MNSIRNSIWSIVGLTSTVPPGTDEQRCLPRDLLTNLETAKKLSSELSVAERNLDVYKDKLTEFGSAFSMTINDLSQLARYHATADLHLSEDLIAKAAELHQQTTSTLLADLEHLVSEPLSKWRITVDNLIVQLEEQRRMHSQQELLREHIRIKEEGRVRLMKTGKWSSKDGADLKRAQDALTSWKLKTEAVDGVIMESVQRDLIDCRREFGLDMMKKFHSIDARFWCLGHEVCKLRAELTEKLSSKQGESPPHPTKKKKKKKKSKELTGARDRPRKRAEDPSDGNVIIDNRVPDILSSFDALQFGLDPFSPSPNATVPSRKSDIAPENVPKDPFEDVDPVSYFTINK